MDKCRTCNHDVDDHRRVVNGKDFCYRCMESPCGGRQPDKPAKAKPAPVKTGALLTYKKRKRKGEHRGKLTEAQHAIKKGRAAGNAT